MKLPVDQLASVVVRYLGMCGLSFVASWNGEGRDAYWACPRGLHVEKLWERLHDGLEVERTRFFQPNSSTCMNVNGLQQVLAETEAHQCEAGGARLP